MGGPFLGEVRWFSFPFAPRGWALCDGSILSVDRHQALFGLIGHLYGGSGGNFQVPNLVGRFPRGGSLVGNSGGSNSVNLSVNNLPAHTHPNGPCNTDDGTTADPENAFPCAASGGELIYGPAGEGALVGGGTRETGGGTPVTTTPPYVTLYPAISLTGTAPVAE